MARTMVVKKLWEYIKGHNLQNPADRRKINLDSELSKLFKPPLTMLNMNKQLSRHCKVDDRGKLLHPRPGLAKRFTLTHVLHLLLLLRAVPFHPWGGKCEESLLRLQRRHCREKIFSVFVSFLLEVLRNPAASNDVSLVSVHPPGRDWRLACRFDAIFNTRFIIHS